MAATCSDIPRSKASHEQDRSERPLRRGHRRRAGFGRAIAERFVASGAKVAIWDHDLPFAEQTAKEIGANVTAFKVDVSDLAAVEKTRDATLKAFGKIDILVNNAGIAGVNKTVWETDLDEWRKVLRINLDGPFICCKAVVPAMLAHKYGRIVNIASIAGKEGNPNAAHYSASKAGLIALTKSLGKELGAARHPRQRGDAGRGKDRDLRSADQKHIDFMLSKIPKVAFRAGGRTRCDGGVACVGRLRFSTGAVFDISGGRATYEPGNKNCENNPMHRRDGARTYPKAQDPVGSGRLYCRLAGASRRRAAIMGLIRVSHDRSERTPRAVTSPASSVPRRP